MSRVLLSFLVLCALASTAFAHEVRPAFLELRQTDSETYTALWKVPGLGDNMRLGIYVELPTGCVNITEPHASMSNGASTERWKLKCENGLSGRSIRITGLSSTSTDVLVRLERLDGTMQISRLTPSAPSFVVEAAPRAMRVAATYVSLGVEHILTGVDHLLFVLALILITGGGWKLVKTVTAFSVSHTITLTAATLGFVHVPQTPVEAVIALSILFVASEIVHSRQGRPGLTERWPWIVALTFGLLHGLGFAGALSEVGLPQAHIPLALLFFSIGVEAGQLFFIASVLLLVAVMRRLKFPTPRWAELVAPYAIGAISAFWIIQRVAAF